METTWKEGLGPLLRLFGILVLSVGMMGLAYIELMLGAVILAIPWVAIYIGLMQDLNHRKRGWFILTRWVMMTMGMSYIFLVIYFQPEIISAYKGIWGVIVFFGGGVLRRHKYPGL
jgi:hypothetical protein